MQKANLPPPMFSGLCSRAEEAELAFNGNSREQRGSKCPAGHSCIGGIARQQTWRLYQMWPSKHTLACIRCNRRETLSDKERRVDRKIVGNAFRRGMGRAGLKLCLWSPELPSVTTHPPTVASAFPVWQDQNAFNDWPQLQGSGHMEPGVLWISQSAAQLLENLAAQMHRQERALGGKMQGEWGNSPSRREGGVVTGPSGPFT